VSRSIINLKMAYYVYILRNMSNKLYIGHTKSLDKRLARHNASLGARYTKVNKSFRLVYSETFPTQLAAMKREKQLKGWRRLKKEALIDGNINLLKNL
jgi:predicted GIY-YIG superfamily endonuclease